MHLHYTGVELGEIEITEQLSSEQQGILKASLLKFGLELMEDKKSMLIEKIKRIVIEMVHYTDELPLLNFSVYLSYSFLLPLGHQCPCQAKTPI